LEAKKSIKVYKKLPNFKGRACNFPALHEGNFAAYFTGCQHFGPKKSIKSRFWRPKSRLKSIKKAQRLPNFKGRACKLDFPALHESNFGAYFTGHQKVQKVDKKSILDPKVDFKDRFFDLNDLIRTHLKVLSVWKQHRTKIEKLFSTSLVIRHIISTCMRAITNKAV